MSEMSLPEAQASREMTPDELVEAAEGFANAGGRTITIPAAWPRLILERERATLAHDRPSGSGLDEVRARFVQMMENANRNDWFAQMRAFLDWFDASTDSEAVGLDVERLRQATDHVRDMSPLDYLDEGDEVDAIAAEYARLSEAKPESPA